MVPGTRRFRHRRCCSSRGHGHPLRVFYAFDPSRNAVLLLGGDKTGDKRFYKTMVPLAEKIWVQYLKETGQ